MSLRSKISFAKKLLVLDRTSWAVLHWRLIKGDSNLRLNYPLKKDSLVFDVGGYHGDWAADIVAKYDCNVMIFEPINEHSRKISERFKENPKIQVFKFGLSNRTCEQKIALLEDGSSLILKSKYAELVQLRNFVEFINEHKIYHIDLIKINIEGEEYPLLNSLIDSGLVRLIDYFQIQFHDFVPGAEILRTEIRRKLSETHQLIYDYPFVWESWKAIEARKFTLR